MTQYTKRIYDSIMLFHSDENEHIRFVARRQSDCTDKIYLYIKVKGHLCHVPYILDDIERFISFLIPDHYFIHLIYCSMTDFLPNGNFIQSFRKRPYIITRFNIERYSDTL